MFDINLVNVENKKFESKEAIIHHLAEVAKENNYIGNIEGYYNSVILREKQTSTSVGHGIAIPHGESNSVGQTFVACCKLNKGILWSDYEGGEAIVNLVFLIGVPQSQRSREHLRILALLSKNLMKEEFLQKLSQAKTKQELYECLIQLKQ